VRYTGWRDEHLWGSMAPIGSGSKEVGMATITEIGADIYRINVEMPGKPVTFSPFLINDDQPTLVQTSYRRVFTEDLG